MSKSPRIGIFSLAYIPFVGGAELAVKEITDRLPGHRFDCFTYKFDQNWPLLEKIGNVDVVRVGNRSKTTNSSESTNYYGWFWQKFFYIFRAWRAAEAAHKSQPFDAIWAMMAAYGGLAALLFKLRHPHIPMLLTLQEGDSEGHILRRVGIFYPIWRLIFKKANYIQTISNYLADFARRHGAKCPVEVVPNGVDLKAFSVERIAFSEKSYILHPKPYTLITTSRLVYKNGIDILIRAFAVIASAAKQSRKHQNKIAASLSVPRKDVRLQILGSGPDEPKLRELAQRLDVADRVEFLGQVEPDKIPEYLNQADIFVRASRSEGLGSSFLEAMAAGLPIIGTPVGGIPDFLMDFNLRTSQDLRTCDVQNINGKEMANGLFVNVDDPVDLADKISLLMNDDQLRKKLGENGRRLVAENYNWDNIAKKMLNIFNIPINHD